MGGIAAGTNEAKGPNLFAKVGYRLIGAPELFALGDFWGKR